MWHINDQALTTADRAKHIYNHMRRRWLDLSLAQQLAVTGSFVVMVSMVILGLWVVSKIEATVTHNTGAAAAIYMNNVIAPLVQELSYRDDLSPDTRRNLDKIFAHTDLKKRIVSFKIWKQGGRIVYSSRGEIIGKVFTEPQSLKKAWGGAVAADFDALDDEEDALERIMDVALLEVYSPIFEKNSDRVMAVGAFYAAAADLDNGLFRALLQSWIVITLLTFAVMFTLLGLVRRASSAIEQQKDNLRQRVAQLSNVLKETEELHGRAVHANQRAARRNERFLRRVSAELHDGPAQLLGLALLRLDTLKHRGAETEIKKSSQSQNLQTVRFALSDALREIRNISSGLALPEVENFTLTETLEAAAHLHERRSETAVKINTAFLPVEAPVQIKICLYRFVQEALSNAFKHAGGQGQSLTAEFDGALLKVVVEDTGQGFALSKEQAFEKGLGLSGLRERIESLEGKFAIATSTGEGTRLTASFTAAALEVQ